MFRAGPGCSSQRTGAEPFVLGDEESPSDSSAKTRWRGSIAYRQVHSFGVKETVVEVLKVNSGKITEGSSCNSIPHRSISAS